MDEKKNKYNVKIDGIGGGESTLVFCAFVTYWLTIEDPDIIDAIIFFLMK